MKNKPQKTKQFNKKKICNACAWTSGSDINTKYYCYYFDKHFQWEATRKNEDTSSVVYLKMTSCHAFHSIPSDMERGAKFAKYFLNKIQIEASSARSWISIFISALAVIVSVFAIILKYTNNGQITLPY